MLGTLALALLLSSGAPAKTPPPAPPAAVSEEAPVVPAVTPEVVGEERRPEVITRTVAVQGRMERGSFWWYVGIIVVAGVILAVLL